MHFQHIEEENLVKMKHVAAEGALDFVQKIFYHLHMLRVQFCNLIKIVFNSDSTHTTAGNISFFGCIKNITSTAASIEYRMAAIKPVFYCAWITGQSEVRLEKGVFRRPLT